MQCEWPTVHHRTYETIITELGTLFGYSIHDNYGFKVSALVPPCLLNPSHERIEYRRFSTPDITRGPQIDISSLDVNRGDTGSVNLLLLLVETLVSSTGTLDVRRPWEHLHKRTSTDFLGELPKPIRLRWDPLERILHWIWTWKTWKSSFPFLSLPSNFYRISKYTRQKSQKGSEIRSQWRVYRLFLSPPLSSLYLLVLDGNLLCDKLRNLVILLRWELPSNLYLEDNGIIQFGQSLVYRGFFTLYKQMFVYIIYCSTYLLFILWET